MGPIEGGASVTKTRPLTPTRSTPQKWPSPNLERVEGVIQDGPKLVDLWDLSPIQRVTDAPNTEVILSLLYPDNPWLCIGATQNYFNTLTLNYWSGKPLQIFHPASTEITVVLNWFISHQISWWRKNQTQVVSHHIRRWCLDL